MSAGIVLQQMVIIFLLIMTGYTAYKKGFLQGDVSKGLSALVVNVCNPALMLRSAFNRDTSVTYESLLLVVVGGAVLYGLLLIVSYFLPRLLRVEEKWRNQYSLMCIFGNNGFIGIPLTAAVLGDQAVIYVAVIIGYFNLVFYTIGIRLADGEKGKVHLKDFVNIGNISIILMVIIFIVQPKLPVVLTSAVNYMADTTTFLAMVVTGISLARTKLLDIFTQRKMYIFIAARFLAVPILIGFLLRPFINDSTVFGVLVLMAAVPAANLPLMRVEEKGRDGQILSIGIILSTVLSLVTIPLVVLCV